MTVEPASQWDAQAWLGAFRRASRRGAGFRPLRARVFESTVQIVRARGYEHPPGAFVEISQDVLDAMHAGTILYEQTESIALAPPEVSQSTIVSVVNSDCLEAAAALVTEGYRPAVLNMASRRNPGGGVHIGAGAQEENLFRRSTAFYSLYQFAPYAATYGVPPAASGAGYPIPRESGGIYSPGVTVFRSSEETGYALLPTPYQVALLTVPAISGPELDFGLDAAGGEPRLTPEMAAGTLPKIRAILRMAGHHGHDALVLSAFGCGAFGNPPGHMADLFRDVLAEAEFANRFSRIAFAILDDYNAGRAHNPEGNYRPFRKVFVEGG